MDTSRERYLATLHCLRSPTVVSLSLDKPTLCVTGRTLRNLTYDAVLAGKYLNIRMHSVPHNNQPDGGFNGTDLDICEPTRPQLAKQ